MSLLVIGSILLGHGAGSGNVREVAQSTGLREASAMEQSLGGRRACLTS